MSNNVGARWIFADLELSRRLEFAEAHANIEFVESLPTWADSIDLEILVSRVVDTAPTVVTWWDVVRAASIANP